jgi:rhomboid protease GluP
MVTHHVSAVSPTSEQLMHWGANNAGSVLIQGQWVRIVTAMFVHVGFLHLALNMWCLWNLGLLAEPLMGSEGVLAVYILTGAAGNLLSTCVNWLRPLFVHWLWLLIHWLWPFREVAASGSFPVGAGASGAVFGIAGALIILLKSHRLPVPPLELKKLRRSVIYFAAINLVIGFTISLGVIVSHTGVSIDNMAHLGGFCCGLLFAAPMVPRIGASREQFLFRRRAAIVMVVGLLVLFGFYLSKLPG